jgi:hypothetical protein
MILANAEKLYICIEHAIAKIAFKKGVEEIDCKLCRSRQ